MAFDTKKVIRGTIVAFIFLCMMGLFGMQIREAHQYLFMVGCMILFGFLLDNIWISSFLWLTSVLFILHKQLDIGAVYLTNVFYGCILYALVKASFKKENIGLYLNAVLWLIFANIVYMSIQLFGYDFLYASPNTQIGNPAPFLVTKDPTGFMGNKSQIGMLMAMGIAILGTKPHKWSIPIALTMFVPIYLSQSAICLLAGVIAILYCLYYKEFKYKGLVLFLCGMVMLFGFSIATFKLRAAKLPYSVTLRLEAWKGILKDAYIHPVTGWGLDSFRNQTPTKPFLYMMNPKKVENVVHMDYMDNPHNLYISLFYEWGIGGMIILIGLIRLYVLRFRWAIKSHEMLALAGIIGVTLITSLAQFPMFLSKIALIVVIAASLYEVQTKG